jgi:hypothetical protein
MFWRAGLLVVFVSICVGANEPLALSQFDVELMLVWAGHLPVPAGEASAAERRSAIQAHQKSMGVSPTGELSSAELAALRARSEQFRAGSAFTELFDKNTGIRLGLPLTYVADEAVRTKRGSEWRDRDKTVTVQTMLIPTSEASLATFYNNMRDLPGRNFTVPKSKMEIGARDERFTLGGDFRTRKFYIHARTDGREIRVLQLSYPEEQAAVFDRIALAMISTFDPFPMTNPTTAPPAILGFPPTTQDTDPRKQLTDFRQERLKEERTALGNGKIKTQRRVALVLGNAAYANAAPLNNAANDADDIADALGKLGFAVIKGIDRPKRETEELLQSFIDRLERSDVALFYYSGHGLQINGRNYVVPTDARIEKERDVPFQAISVDFILEQMESTAPTNLIFLDACRDNPFARNLSLAVSRSMLGRPVEVLRGLAQVTPGVGTFIAFSTSPNKVASDGAGRNSPFTGALKRHIATPDVSVSDLLITVRNEVLEETKQRQLPWDQSALIGTFYFATSHTAGRN